jgi:hypothetical protein
MKLVKKVLLMFMEHIFGKLPPDFYVHWIFLSQEPFTFYLRKQNKNEALLIKVKLV